MKIDKLNIFYSELILEFREDCDNCELHFHTSENWINISNASPADSRITNSLDRSKSESIFYHTANSPTVWFYISDANATVSLTFAKSPQIQKKT